MTSNEQFESDLRSDLARHKHSGNKQDIRALAVKVENYIDYCIGEHARWHDARKKVETDFETYVGAIGSTLPREQREKVLGIMLEPIREKEAEVDDLSQRLKRLLGDIQAEVAELPT